MSDAPNVTTAPLAIGRYQVTDTLGEGGMGVVYLARDPQLERFVAIKLMRAGFDTADMRERFGREARAVAALRHPYIVTLFEYGEHNGQPFIVMEYVSGKTLASLIVSRAPMSQVRRLKLLEDLCDGLEHAHKRGIIHRDVKPANIMVDAEGTLQILDFGIAKQDHGTNATQSNALAGTPKYMSPEQISGKVVTRRSDIFSVGLVAYELFTGEPAFSAASHFATMDAILNQQPRPLEAHVPSLDPRIVRIVMKALEKDPDRRYQDMAQMRRDVERIRLELALADRAQEPTTTIPTPASLPDLADRRQQQIGANLETADRAFELGDFEAALVACEDVLIIDPHNARAHDGRGRAHAALTERQAFGHLNVARQHLSRGEFTLAEAALQAALAIVPGLGEGIELQEELGSARYQQEQRVRALKSAIDKARIRFQEGAFESAIDAANEALEYSPVDSEARRLKADAVLALEDRRRQQEIARRAQSAADEAARLSARDRYADALRVLDDPLIAGHATVRQARAVVTAAEAEFRQLAAAADERARLALNETVVVHPGPPTGSFPDTLALHPLQTPLQTTLSAAPADRTETLWLLGIAHADGADLEGPVRARRPKPTRRPVQFLDAEANRAGAREWLEGQRVASVTQGRGSISFGISLITHLILATTAAAFVLGRTIMPPPPLTRTAVSVLDVLPPAPKPVPQKIDPPPQRPSERPRPTPAPPTAPRHTQPETTTPAAAEVHDTTPAPITPPLERISTTSELPSQLGRTDVLAPPGPPSPPSSDPAAGDFTPVTDFDQGPVLQRKAEPKLPAGASGSVRVEVTIVPDGRVSRVKVLDTTPYASLIADAAANCVFRPAKRRGKAVTVVVTIVFQFDTRK